MNHILQNLRNKSIKSFFQILKKYLKMATKKKIDLNEETDEVPNKLANRIGNSDQKSDLFY